MKISLKSNLFRVLCLGLLIGAGATGVYVYQTSYTQSPLRLHVIANSDSPYDQQVKLIVRDKVLEILEDELKAVEDKDQAMLVIADNIPALEEGCREVLKDYADYDLKACLGEASFPTKSYGDMVLPAGEYDALRVVLGEGEGKNWWCVLFPLLCFVDLASDQEQTVMSSPVGDLNTPAQETIQVRFKLNELLER